MNWGLVIFDKRGQEERWMSVSLFRPPRNRTGSAIGSVFGRRPEMPHFALSEVDGNQRGNNIWC